MVAKASEGSNENRVMSDKNDKIKKLAGSVLSQFEAEPPADMWSRIEMQTRRKKRLLLFRVLAMAASMLILLGVGFSLLMPDSDPGSKSRDLSQNKGSESRNLTRETSKQSATDHAGLSGAGLAKQPPIASPVKQSENNKIIAYGQNGKTEGSMLGEQLQDTKPLQTDIKPPEQTLTEETIPVTVSTEDVVAIVETAKITAPEDISDVSVTDITLLMPEPPQESSKSNGSNNWSLALGYGTSSSIEMTQQEAALNSSGGNFSYDELSAEVANNTSYFEDIESTSHNAPLSLGFIISKKTGKRWYFETGLLYTRLGYHIKTLERNNTYQQYNNQLYYLGLPAGVRFGILERKRFGIFATQSVIFEKGVVSTGYTETFTNGILTNTESNKTDIRGIQLSSLTGMGGDIKIAGNISVYGQAGLQLFFLNRSQPYNIRSARVAWPSFQVGLRMKLE
jgi:hypothetical protein